MTKKDYLFVYGYGAITLNNSEKGNKTVYKRIDGLKEKLTGVRVSIDIPDGMKNEDIEEAEGITESAIRRLDLNQVMLNNAKSSEKYDAVGETELNKCMLELKTLFNAANQIYHRGDADKHFEEILYRNFCRNVPSAISKKLNLQKITKIISTYFNNALWTLNATDEQLQLLAFKKGQYVKWDLGCAYYDKIVWGEQQENILLCNDGDIEDIKVIRGAEKVVAAKDEIIVPDRNFSRNGDGIRIKLSPDARLIAVPKTVLARKNPIFGSRTDWY